jgi:peroxiredoxin
MPSILVLAALLAQAGADKPTIKDFALPDAEGRQHTAAEWKGQKAVVLLFLGTECPVSNGYAPVFTRLEKAFAPRGVRFYGVHADPDVTAETAAKHAAEYGLRFPVLLDPAQRVVRQAGVAIMPTAVVVSPAGQVLYRGRIDDRYSPEGKRREEPTSHDLEAALSAVVAGKAPPVAETKPFGCPLPPPAK